MSRLTPVQTAAAPGSAVTKPLRSGGRAIFRLRLGGIATVLVGMALPLLLATSQRAPAFLQNDSSSCGATATRMARLELLFGMSRPDGRNIAESEWQTFVDTEVTPRFPHGLTVMSGSGQWRGRAGTIAREGSRILIVWYPTKDRESEANIEGIRRAYKAQISQESVMRVDSSSCVSF
jgi:hypothetical protein